MREPLVLCYHAVSRGWDAPLAVTPEQLEQQVRWLLRLGFRPETFTGALLAPRHEKAFAVTFDDAYRSVLEQAAPVLDRLGVAATLFVPTGWVGTEHRRAAWPEMEQWQRPGHERELELMDWDEIRALAERGWEIGAHSRTHPRLTQLEDGPLQAELVGSRMAVETELGRPCPSIAYPYGDVDARVAQAAEAAGFATGAALADLRGFVRDPEADVLRWRRIGIYAADTRPRFGVKLAAGAAATVRPRTPVARPGAPRHDGAPGRPRVAVIIPCFNDGRLALEAVASVDEREPVELVVVDDASTEAETATALDALRARGVTVVRHEVNRGLSAARRTGLAATTAPYVFPLDSDDLLVRGALKRLADRLDTDPGAAAAYGDTQEFGTRSRLDTKPVALDAYRVAFRNRYPVCSLFRRVALVAAGAWQDVGGMVGYEDWALWMTLAERGERAVHVGPGFVAVRYRLHGPRMYGDAAARHRRLYAELRRSHPRLFAELGRHRRASPMGPVQRLTYPWLFGDRPPIGLRDRVSAALPARRRTPSSDAS